VTSYPEGGSARDEWILARRSARNPVDPRRPFQFFIEKECAESGEVLSVATLFLTNRECPWRCLMCDLWKNTLTETVPAGAIPEQIDWALARMAERSAETECALPRQIKLYNSGSFFDPRAIPPEDYLAIAARGQAFERVMVECHPALVGPAVVRFRDLLGKPLEVAMGLETAHPDVLSRLNKRMTLDQFSRAAEFLRHHGLALRVFILVKPPFLQESEALDWAQRSMDFAFDHGASVVSLIPTRFGNGALEELARRGEFSPPKLSVLEAAADFGIRRRRGRVFADLWDLGKFSDCGVCFQPRVARLREMNLRQLVLPRVECSRCETERLA